MQRVHLLDATIEGALLLELYTRDGIGTMVARQDCKAVWSRLGKIYVISCSQWR